MSDQGTILPKVLGSGISILCTHFFSSTKNIVLESDVGISLDLYGYIIITSKGL